jgi:hypothetical protein
MFALLGASGSVERLRRLIPSCVVRGLQLGLGLKVVATGLGMATKTRLLIAGPNLDGLLTALVSAAVALALYGDRKRPASLALFCLGCIGVARSLSRNSLSFSLALPIAPVPSITADDWWHSLVHAALPRERHRIRILPTAPRLRMAFADPLRPAGGRAASHAAQRSGRDGEARGGSLPATQDARCRCHLDLDRRDQPCLCLLWPLPFLPWLWWACGPAPLWSTHRVCACPASSWRGCAVCTSPLSICTL